MADVIFDPEKNKKYSITSILKNIESDRIDLQNYGKRYKKKLEIVQNFLNHWQRSSNWKQLGKGLSEAKELAFLDLKIDKKDLRYNKKTIELIKKAIKNEPDADKKGISSILISMETLNSVYKELREIIKAQIKWFESNKDSLWKEHNNIHAFLKLIRKESILLTDNNFAGKSIKELVDSIYAQVMPLKYRIIEKRELKGGWRGKVTLWNIIGMDPVVVKTFGLKHWVIGDWEKKKVKAMLKRFSDYHESLRAKGVSVPPRNVVSVIGIYETLAETKGIKFTEKYQVAIKQKYIGISLLDFLNSTRDKQAIKHVWEQALENTIRATSGYRGLRYYAHDIHSRNFCISSTGKVFYIDLEPKRLNLSEKMIYPFRWFLSTEKKYNVIGRGTLGGMCSYMLWHAIGFNQDLEEFLIQITLKYLEKRSPKAYKFMVKFVKKKFFRDKINEVVNIIERRKQKEKENKNN
tara:strand:+ start:11368 stop:12759 length:1392 start_codon:yes stop_codon:yes gene_type:complete